MNNCTCVRLVKVPPVGHRYFKILIIYLKQTSPDSSISIIYLPCAIENQTSASTYENTGSASEDHKDAFLALDWNTSHTPSVWRILDPKTPFCSPISRTTAVKSIQKQRFLFKFTLTGTVHGVNFFLSRALFRIIGDIPRRYETVCRSPSPYDIL